MATNERVVYTSNDIYHGQQAASQASRTNFTPGKASGRAGDMNWPTDFRIPQGTPAYGSETAGPVEMNRDRVVKLHRNIVCDQVIGAPSTGIPIVTSITNAEAGINGTSVLTPTITQVNDGTKERTSGQDRIVGA